MSIAALTRDRNYGVFMQVIVPLVGRQRRTLPDILSTGVTFGIKTGKFYPCFFAGL